MLEGSGIIAKLINSLGRGCSVFELMLLEGLPIEELVRILTRPVIASVNLLVLVLALMFC